MTKEIYEKIIKEVGGVIIKVARQNDWLWFYDLHQKEVVRGAEKLLKLYKADRKIVMLAAWLHDISKFKIKNKKDTAKFHKTHHLDSARLAREILAKYNLPEAEINKICDSILRHRNTKPYLARNIEEKILAVADTLSHFTGVFYFLHFKFHPEDKVEEMVRLHLEKLKRDWRDLGLLPAARSLVRSEYEAIFKMHKNYLKA